MMLDGFVVHERVSARAAIEQLMRAYFFTMRERENGLVALPRDASVDMHATVEQCIALRQDNQEVAYELVRAEDLVLPDSCEVHYLDRLQSYATVVALATRGTQAVTETEALKFSTVISDAHAQAIAQAHLAQRWAERSRITLQLPMRFAALEVADVLELTAGDVVHRVRVLQVQIGRPGIVRVQGVIDSAQTWDGYLKPTVGSDGALVLPPADTHIEVLDIPAFPGDAQDSVTLRFAACGVSPGWQGAAVVRELGEDDETILTLDRAATLGTCTSVLADGARDVFDRVNSLDVLLMGEQIVSGISELSVLNGANVALVGNEIIQFASVTALADRHYRLSNLLRGRLGTEHAMATHGEAERFVLLDQAVRPLVLGSGVIGQVWDLRAATFGTSLDEGSAVNISITGSCLKPYTPTDIQARKTGGDIAISFKRRARIDGSWRDLVDVPLMEQSEAYDVAIMDGVTVKRSWRVVSPNVTYTHAEQTADWGSEPTNLTIKVSQLSALVGAGEVQLSTVEVA